MAKEALLNYISLSSTSSSTMSAEEKARIRAFFDVDVSTGNVDIAKIKEKVGSRIIFAGDGHIFTHGQDLLEKFAILANRKTLTLKYDNSHLLTYDPFVASNEEGGNYSVDLGDWLASLTTSAMHYRGLTSSKTAPTVAKPGDFYKVSGVTDNTIFGIAGGTTFEWSIGDAVVYNSDNTWERIPSGDSKWNAGVATNLSWTALTALGAIDGVIVNIPKLPSISEVISITPTPNITTATSGYYTIGSIVLGPTGSQTTYTFLGKDTTYTFTSGTTGDFTVTPVGGSALTVSIGKPAVAGTADVANKIKEILSFGEGLTVGSETVEGTTTKLTYDGSVARTISLVQATSTTLGGIMVPSGANLTLGQDGALSLTQTNVLNALGIQSVDALTNSWRPVKVNHTSIADGNKSSANNHTPDNYSLDFISTESGIMALSVTTTNADKTDTLHIGFSLAWYNISTGQYELPSASYVYNSSTGAMETPTT